MNEVKPYVVTDFQDDEGHNSILTFSQYQTITSTILRSSIPSFVTLDGNNTLKFYSNSFSLVGMHKLQLTLSDS
jgi:hypothetical protein